MTESITTGMGIAVGFVLIAILIAVILFIMASGWILFKKIGHRGWLALIPGCNTFLLIKALFGSGYKIFMFLIPFYNVVFLFRICYVAAKKFGHHGIGYMFALVFLQPVFMPILALGSSQFENGEHALTYMDFVTAVIIDIKKAYKKKVQLKKDYVVSHEEDISDELPEI